jgi:hypothetical protein
VPNDAMSFRAQYPNAKKDKDDRNESFAFERFSNAHVVGQFSMAANLKQSKRADSPDCSGNAPEALWARIRLKVSDKSAISDPHPFENQLRNR